MEYIDMSLEDLAMGKLPKKVMGKKAEKLGTSTMAVVKKVNKTIDMLNSKSVNSYKGLNMTEMHALLAAYDKAQDAMYRAKEMIREAMPKEKRKGSTLTYVDDSY